MLMEQEWTTDETAKTFYSYSIWKNKPIQNPKENY